MSLFDTECINKKNELVHLHIFYHLGSKFRSFEFGCSFHLPVKIVGHRFISNGFLH